MWSTRLLAERRRLKRSLRRSARSSPVLFWPGGAGTGAYNYNTAFSRLEAYTINTLPAGATQIPITLTGGGTTFISLPVQGGLGAGAATVQSNVPVNPTVDLGQQIRATNEETKISTDPNKDKNKLTDDGC